MKLKAQKVELEREQALFDIEMAKQKVYEELQKKRLREIELAK